MVPPQKEGGEKKGRFAIIEVVTREHTISIHKHIHGVGFKKCSPWALKEIQKFVMKEMGTADAALTPGSVSVPYGIRVQLSRKHNEIEESPSKYMLVTSVPVTTFKNLQTDTLVKESIHPN
uniref:Large ribosomal subunit protein eL31 n=1 Tax=Myotis lucifugus TaxID=59463 RepID=G1Q1F9_MYOLU